MKTAVITQSEEIIDYGVPVSQSLETSTEQMVTSSGLTAGVQALGLDGKLLVAQIINFVILVILLHQFLYKPLLSMLEKRRATIAESVNRANEIEVRYQAFQVEHEKRLTESKKEAAAIITSAKEAAESLRQETLKQNRQEVEKMLAKARTEMANQKEGVLRELRSELGSLVVLVTKKVIGQALDKTVEERLAKEAIQEVNQ